MYQTKTKDKIIEIIKRSNEITANKLQYLGEQKKQIHNSNLLKILYDLEKENLIIITEHIMNDRVYRVIKWSDKQ